MSQNVETFGTKYT